jgi:dihydroorotase
MNILIKNGHIIDPANNVDGMFDLLVTRGKFEKLGTPGSIAHGDAQMLDAAGKIVVPGLIDMHVHLREPGFEYKETIATGTAAARAGGFTAVCCMPNTNPVNDTRSVTEYILSQAAREASARVLPIGAITKGSKGEELAEIGDLREAGCVGVSDDGRPVAGSAMMRRAMEYSRTFDLPVLSHCEDAQLAAKGVMNEGFVATELGLRGIPNAAEDVMVARDIVLAELTGARVHLCHVSTAGAVRMIRNAKQRGVQVTAETCPHYFTLTDEAVRGYNTMAKMNPPLRSATDRDAVREGLKDGTIDVIVTDHAPHALDEKMEEFDLAPFGIVGLETAVGLALGLVHDGVLTLADLVRRMSVQPAEILKVRGGSLSIGATADITIIDPELAWTVDASQFRSRSRNTPFDGWKLKGKVIETIVGGVL